MAVETGIAPNALLESPPGMLEAMHDYMRQRAIEQSQTRR
jgi:hypothetical protein